jgi:hypothetical protein
MNTTTIKMQATVDFAVEAMNNVAMFLAVIKENAIDTNNAQIIDQYAVCIDRIDWVIDALRKNAVFTQRIPVIAKATSESFVMKAYANCIRNHYNSESIISFSNLYGESLNWDDEDYDGYSETLAAIAVLDDNCNYTLHEDFCRLCRFMLNWYDRQNVKTIGEKPWSEHQVSISYMFDCIGWLFSNADLNTK